MSDPSVRQIKNLADLVDVYEHLIRYLHMVGIIKDSTQFRDSLETYIENKGTVSGEVKIEIY